MLGSGAIIELVAKAVRRSNLFPLVVDPVMFTKSGERLLDESAMNVLCKKRGLLSLAAVVTPSGREAARLLGQAEAITDIYGATDAAKRICAYFGAKACVIKGIKVPDSQEGQAVDVFFDGKDVRQVVSEWRPTTNTRGSGCTFSGAITAALARGEPLEQAVQTAKNVVSEAIRQVTDLGHGTAPVNPLAYAKLKK
jgi:hydroxymethylpyrimidine/phosphomethylpyrimidine kinase